MPKYEVCLPVYAFLIYEVDAEDEDAAYESEAPKDAIYQDSSGGLSSAHGCRLTASCEYMYDKMDVIEK